MLDIYWSIITPSQALLMLAGCPPPAPKYVVREMEEQFVKKEKLLEKKYINTLDKIVKLYKSFEYKKLKSISGKEIDQLIKDSEEYMKRLSELRKQIENSSSKKTIERIYEDLMKVLKAILGNHSVEKILKEFDKNLIKTAKLTNQHSRILSEIISVRNETKKGKIDINKIDKTRREASILMNALLEYSQRKEFACLDRSRINLEYGENKKAQLLLVKDLSFIFYEDKIKKITNKIQDSNSEEVSSLLEKQNPEEEKKISPQLFEKVKSLIGEFKIIF